MSVKSSGIIWEKTTACEAASFIPAGMSGAPIGSHPHQQTPVATSGSQVPASAAADPHRTIHNAHVAAGAPPFSLCCIHPSFLPDLKCQKNVMSIHHQAPQTYRRKSCMVQVPTQRQLLRGHTPTPPTSPTPSALGPPTTPPPRLQMAPTCMGPHPLLTKKVRDPAITVPRETYYTPQAVQFGCEAPQVCRVDIPTVCDFHATSKCAHTEPCVADKNSSVNLPAQRPV